MTEDPLPATNLGEVVDVVKEMIDEGIVADYAIGGAVAAILHYEPFSTFDLDIFFLINDLSDSLVLDMTKIYDWVRAKGFAFDHEFVMICGGRCNSLRQATTRFGLKQYKRRKQWRLTDVR